MSILSNEQITKLTQQIRAVLTSGLHVVVLGVNGHRHDQEIARLAGKRVLLYDSTPATGIGSSVGIVLHTKHVDHRDTERIRNGRLVYKPSVEISLVKAVLRSCKDLINPAPRKSVALPVVEERPSGAEMSDAVLDFLTTPRRDTMTKMEMFVRDFLVATQASSDGLISSHALGILRDKHKIVERAEALEHKRWVVGVISEGKGKTGWYKPGEKMGASTEQQTVEPDNSYDRAKHLVAQEAELLSRQADLAVEQVEVVKKLERIKIAKMVLDQLDNV